MSVKFHSNATPQLITSVGMNRRLFLKLGLGVGIAPISSVAQTEKSAKYDVWTPSQTEGPFYPVHQQQDKDIDLTLVSGRTERAKGKVIYVRGKVLDLSGAPIANVFIDMWQANTWGRYRHKRDPNSAPLDPNFQGWGQTYSDADGKYGFKTILPGAYPAGPQWTRPPHIHFKIAKQGFYPLTTQMYFPGEALNKQDLILQNLSVEQQELVIAERQKAEEVDGPVYIFNIVLRGVGENNKLD